MHGLVYPYIKLPVIYTNIIYLKPCPPQKPIWSSSVSTTVNHDNFANSTYANMVYEGRLVTYEMKMEKFITKSCKQLQQFNKQITMPSFEHTDKIKHNPAEKKFARLIEKSFKIKAHLDAYLSTLGTIWYPDILLMIYGKNIVLDIEIDEPYVWNTKQPIHYDTSDDNLRDQMLTDNGWIVIRFTERQIKSQPVECIRFIASTIRSYLNFDTMPDANNYSINIQNKWSYSQAQFFAKCNYRMKY